MIGCLVVTAVFLFLSALVRWEAKRRQEQEAAIARMQIELRSKRAARAA